MWFDAKCLKLKYADLPAEIDISLFLLSNELVFTVISCSQ